jgi:YgiT-type zinc finger domain-containing protein
MNPSGVPTFRRTGALLVMRNVPTEVCDVCGDALFHKETMHQNVYHRR